MADIDSRNQRLQEYNEDIKDIRVKIKDVAENKDVTIVEGTDTPLTVLTKIDNATIKTPTESLTITTNTTTNVTNYASVTTNVPSDSIDVVDNDDNTQTLILNSSGVVQNTAKGLADGSLTSFSAPQWGVTSLAPRRFENFTSLTSLDLTGVTNIPEYTAYLCNNIRENLILDVNTVSIGQYAFYSNSGQGIYGDLVFNYPGVSVGNNAFYGNHITSIVGHFSNLSSQCFWATGNHNFNKLHIKITGSVTSRFLGANSTTVSDFVFDPTSNITSLGQNTFEKFGNNRANPENNIFIFDFRNSTFTSVGTSCFYGDSYVATFNKYFDIYFPNTLNTITTSVFQNTDHFNIYYKNVPALSNVNSFAGATNYKNFFPYNLVQTAKTATNWTSSTNGINASIYGYSDANEFSLGDTLPVADNDGYALTWYSDREMTTQVTTVTDPTQMYYCQVGARTYVKLSTTQYQATLTVSDGVNTYTDGDLLPIGATLTITAVGDTGYPDPYTFTLNGTTISSGDTYTVAQDDIAIICIYYDGVNPPVDPVFANNTPQQIKIAVDNGLHRILWAIGDTKTITLTNNNTVTVVYRDQQANRYEKVDGTGYSNAVFEIIPMQTQAAMNSTGTNAGGWAASEMNTTTMAEIYNLLPSDWQAIISEVKVPSATSGNNSTIVYADNKMFIPSAQEIFGNSYINSYYYNEGCTQFDWYSTHNTNADRIRQYNNTNTSYWLRSPYFGRTTYFVTVDSSGSIYFNSASSSYGVVPCFSI